MPYRLPKLKMFLKSALSYALLLLLLGSLACMGGEPAEPEPTPDLGATVAAAVAAALPTATPTSEPTPTATVPPAIPKTTPTPDWRPDLEPPPELLLEMPANHAEALKSARAELRALQVILDQLDHREHDGLHQTTVHSLARVNQQLDCLFGQDARQLRDSVSESGQIRMAEACLVQLGGGYALLAGAQLTGYAHAIFGYSDVTFEEANKISEMLLLGGFYTGLIANAWECYAFAWGKVPYPSLPTKCR